jgi:regulator of sigma E protease
VALGVVIFIHELGHFLLAKWNGVKVEKFSIGFGPTLFGFRRGETQYVLAAVPLGGFVKMLGEGPEDEQNKSTDPRAYPNKPVSARMAIISAGVIMNLIFGWLCFSYGFTHERLETPTVLGAVVAGSPAYAAGLREGDAIVSVDGERDPSFTSLLRKISLSSEGQVLHMEAKRPGREGLVAVDVQPRREADGDRPTVGIAPQSSLMILDFEPPAGMAAPPAYPQIDKKDRLSKVDMLATAGPEGTEPTSLADFSDYRRILASNADRPIVHKIERRLLASLDSGPVLDRFQLVLPPVHVVGFGLRLAIEPIKSIRKDSPAEEAGFREGDLIVKFDGHDDFDPLRLPSLCFELAGKPVTVEVQRPSSSGVGKIEHITVTPSNAMPRTELVFPNEPVDVPGLGLCYHVASRVAGVTPDSPAAKAAIKPGDVINSLTLPAVPPSSQAQGQIEQSELKAKTFDFDSKPTSWQSAFIELQNRPIRQVELTVNKGSTPVKLTPVPHDHWYNFTRGLQFGAAFRKVPPQGLVAALRSGFDETIDNIGQILATFRSLAQRRVGPKSLGGPLMIMEALARAADSGFNSLIFVLGLVSVALAVFNFLPVPPLDGGQMVFLVAEKLRGRPLPDSAVIVATYFGLLLVLCLMVFVTYQDILRNFGLL